MAYPSAMEYEAVIGLETHVQLRTRSKMWCGCENRYGAEPNSLVCPVCLGMPGVLPVANAEALRLTVKTGLLLNSQIPEMAKFDRKNYFYPDSAKNYQITQYDRPSTAGGYLDFEHGDGLVRVRITRAHLEEDVGKNFHYDRFSGVDFNRAGVPLLEIVSEPDIRSADMAYDYLNALKEVLIQGGISDCDMEKGMVRCDVNISVRPKGTDKLGSKVEIKNMNTFSGVRRAILHEVDRQIRVVTRGGTIPQETRRWDDVAGYTESMRSKEDAHDYRYFPEPDLMPHRSTPDWVESIRVTLPELPLARKQRFMNTYGLPSGDAEVFKSDRVLGDYYEKIAQGSPHAKALANWLVNGVRAHLAVANEQAVREAESMGMEPEDVEPQTVDDLKFGVNALPELVELVDSGKISSRIAQDVFAEMVSTGDAPAVIVDRHGWIQVSDTGALEAFCDQVIAAHPGPAEDFRSGKAAALNFLKGQVMKLSKGKANPARVGEILEKKLRA